MWNKDEMQGKADKVKGKAKQAVGDLRDDQQLHDEGVSDEAAGEIQDAFGKGRRQIGNAIKDLGDQVKK
jgi:uncharacterized protein YjbJ (UPF0337 family)